MYKPPIEVVYGKMQTQIEGDVLRVVQDYGITVDKEELIAALAYDRKQYDKGYECGYHAGFINGNDAIVECRYCKDFIAFKLGSVGTCRNKKCKGLRFDSDFCSYGERKDGAGE